jgi:NTE family protein
LNEEHAMNRMSGERRHMKASIPKPSKRGSSLLKVFVPCIGMYLIALLVTSCAHYPINQPLTKHVPPGADQIQSSARGERSDDLFLMLTFSGGGTRAAAFSYGVLEELAKTGVTVNGQKRRLLDEVDVISGVSGGSFTAAYYGLFGDRIFQDFESRFLKENIQGALSRRVLLNPINWIRFLSPTFDRSDLAAEYYDQYIFDGATFGDLAVKKGPIILINATDMVTGIRVAFTRDSFNVLCSDLSTYPVARAVAASSAVPILLSPITLRNYAGTCGYEIPEDLKKIWAQRPAVSRQFYYANSLIPYLDSAKKTYIHLVDGGVADNLGLRALLDRVMAFGDIWTTIKNTPLKNVHKVVFVVVNAETEVSHRWDKMESPPALAAMIDSYSSVSIARYNFETLMLLRESFDTWKEEIRTNRCSPGPVMTDPGSCGDIEFYMVEVKFDALSGEEERTYFKMLPTSFVLKPEEVDKLRDAAHRILVQSPEFQRVLKNLK